ncbi:MAG: hypothetical protein ACHBN1_21845 [Heteroscytonema crispum UTEX LB 1556]
MKFGSAKGVQLDQIGAFSPKPSDRPDLTNGIIVIVRTYWRQDHGLRTSFSTVN